MTGAWVDLAFWVFAAAAVWFGWRVFRTDSMLRASYALLASFLNVGAILVLLLAEYVGVALLFMMTVEMVVMALFMIMFMMNPAGLNPMQMVHQHRFSIGAGSLLAGTLVTAVAIASWPDRPLTDPETTIVELGTELLGGSMLVFESVGVTLLVTMIGSVILSAARGRYGDSTDADSVPPPIDPADPDSWRHAEPVASADPHGGHHGDGDHGGHG